MEQSGRDNFLLYAYFPIQCTERILHSDDAVMAIHILLKVCSFSSLSTPVNE